MVDLVQLKVNLILALLLKFIEVYDFPVYDFVFVVLIELYYGDAKVVWIQINSQYPIFK